MDLLKHSCLCCWFFMTVTWVTIVKDGDDSNNGNDNISVVTLLQAWKKKNNNNPYYTSSVQIMQKLSKYLVIMTNEISLPNIWCSAVFTWVTLATVRGCVVITCPTLGREAFVALTACPRFVCGSIDTITHSVPFFSNHGTLLSLRWIKLFTAFLSSFSYNVP